MPDGLSWDNALINYCVRLPLHSWEPRLITGLTRRFVGKTFEQECAEVENAFEYYNKNIFSQDFIWGLSAFSWWHYSSWNSESSLANGNGDNGRECCGKNPETTKPLLSTLPDTEQLLHPLDDYRGTFIFLHGEADTIVPKSSQEMIYDRAARHSAKHEWIDLQNLDHSLRETNTKESRMAEIGARYIRENFWHSYNF